MIVYVLIALFATVDPKGRQALEVESVAFRSSSACELIAARMRKDLAAAHHRGQASCSKSVVVE